MERVAVIDLGQVFGFQGDLPLADRQGTRLRRYLELR